MKRSGDWATGEFQRTWASSTAERGLASSCNTCTRPTHGKAACPGKTVRCYSCGLTGHFRGSKACRAKQAEDKEKNWTEQVNKLDGSEDEMDSIGQVTEDVNWAAGSTPKGRTADVLLTALHGGEITPMKANLLIDSGVYKTLLMK